ncbi:MAG TPA: TetR family transcriptional regulator [Polyangiaceae bacterium]|nr:TetR family transcriptional regulator [Polyangiaceae bacterium]
MKVTKEKRDEIRRSLVSAAVELFSKQGLSETSLREIAARAGVAPGTVYKYFPTREQIFYAYFEIKQKDVNTALGKIAGFETFTFKEKLQAYVEALLSAYVEDREFVAVAMEGLIESPLKSYGALQAVKKQVTVVVERFFAEAIAKGEIREGEYNNFLIHLFWDYTTVVLIYWLKDTSENFSLTSEFVDITLDLYVELVQAAVVEKGVKVAAYLLKSHLYGNLDRFLGLASALGSYQTGRMGRREPAECRDNVHDSGADEGSRTPRRVHPEQDNTASGDRSRRRATQNEIKSEGQHRRATQSDDESPSKGLRGHARQKEIGATANVRPQRAAQKQTEKTAREQRVRTRRETGS